MLKASELKELDPLWIKEIGAVILKAHGDFKDHITREQINKAQRTFLESFGYKVKEIGHNNNSHFEVSWSHV